MSYTLVNCLGTEYAVDWSVVERLCLSHWTSYYQLRHASAVPVAERTWNPISWSLPTITTVEIPWNKVRDDARAATAKDMAVYAQRSRTDMRGVALDVKWRVENTAVNRRKLAKYLKDIQSVNTSEVESAVGSYTESLQTLRSIRDTAADIVTIGSIIAVTGGGALLGAASALKAWGKYQDSGSVGAAALYGAGNVFVGVFKLGNRALSQSAEYSLILVQGSLETGTSLVAGDTFAKAVADGGLKIASAGGAQAIFGSKWVKSVFSRMPLPFNVWAPHKRNGLNIRYEDRANEFVEKSAKKATEKSLKSKIEAATATPAAGSPAVSAGLVNDVPIEQMFLLYLSIVHMTKGIGHGW